MNYTYKGVEVTRKQWEALMAGEARLIGSRVVFTSKGKAISVASKEFYKKGTFQIPHKHLEKIYGKSSSKQYHGRTIYPSALGRNRQYHSYLRPLGVGERVKYGSFDKTGEFRGGRKIQVIDSKREIGKLRWDKNGRLVSSERTTQQWHSQIGKKITINGQSMIPTLDGKKWAIHIQVAAHQIQINSFNFVQVMTRYAKRIFEESFNKQKFNTYGGEKWPELSTATLSIRARRGIYHDTILEESGQLKNSLRLKFSRSLKQFTGSVITGNVKDRDGHYPVCYAAVHNEADHDKGALFGWRSLNTPTRQFMGHSSYIFRYAMQIRDNYFLRDVFLLPTKRR